MPNKKNDDLNDVMTSLIFAGLSIEQMGKLPKWLLENIENNKPKLQAHITQNYRSVDSIKEACQLEEETWYNKDLIEKGNDYERKFITKEAPKRYKNNLRKSLLERLNIK